jgi:predicted DNA-binding transcriptional regulator AlpA
MAVSRFLTDQQVRKVLNCSRATLWRWARQGDGPPRCRLTPGLRGPWFYPEDGLNAWIAARLGKPSSQPAE